MSYSKVGSWENDQDSLPVSIPLSNTRYLSAPFLSALFPQASEGDRRDTSQETLLEEARGGYDSYGLEKGKLRLTKKKLLVSIACILLAIIGAVITLLTFRSTPVPFDEYDRTLILISLDGFKASYLHRNLTPTLARIAKNGVHGSMQPVFPSLTFPNHYTLVTGLYPESHGIVANVFFDQEREETFIYVDRQSNSKGYWWGGEPVWVTAIKQGHSSAACMWPGSEAPIQGIRPTHWVPYNHTMPLNERADHILNWLDKPANERPSIMTMYMSDVDSAGHLAGVNSAEVNVSLARVDKAIEYLMDGIERKGLSGKLNVMVVSDHGMSDSSKERLIFLDDFIDLNDVVIIENRPLIMLYPNRVNDTDNILLSLSRAAKLSGQFTVWKREDAPLRFHYADSHRIGPIVAIPQNGWAFTARTTYDPKKPLQPLGMHGYDNSLEDMAALFLASGPAFKHIQDTIPSFPNVELYQLMCRIIGVQPAAHNGTREFISTFQERYMSAGWI